VLLRLLALVVACLTLCAEPKKAVAGDFEPSDESWQGTSELYAIAKQRLGEGRVEVLATLDYGRLKPADGVLLLHPENDADYDELSAFLRAGGRLAVLDDFGSGGKLLARFDIQRVAAPLRPAHTLRRRAAFAIAVPATQVIAGETTPRHPVVSAVDQLVTNHPAALRHPNLTPVLEIPAVGEPPAALAVTGIIVNRGRLFAMADPSALINLMLRYPGNRAFAEGLVNYLVEDDSWGARGGKLYIVANRFKQQGAYGGGESLGDELRQHLAGALELADDVRRDGLPEVLAVLLGGAAALGAAVWMARLASRPYRRTLPRFAQPIPLLALGGAAGRAAVLAAPDTSRALVILELRAALVEALTARLRLAPPVSSERLLAEIDRQGALALASSARLKAIFRELDRAERAVASGAPLSVGDGELDRLRAEVEALVREASGAVP
jgi:hypothetical protein